MCTNKAHTCCFTGHRKLPNNRLASIIKHLEDAVSTLIGQGVTDFISGGALGFDQLAAMLVVAKRERGHNVRLILALPCKNQDDFWAEEQKELYRYLLDKADEIIYVSEKYSDGCMKKRNYYMVDRSAYCICAWLHPLGGTAQTVAYARQKRIKVINIT